ncbi:hypothetical protein D1867_03730 [Acidianus infernus]|uniref:Uncharacterized protein n=1 Tax=Acidianus infernus TaxID=12915 RepID=A0A6A9QC20_ACIIN|nr:hypothetical protein [Acidianus infernus]MCY0873394.1 hypothetical protein [Acidianus infernus]MCY0882614.1 hypothetical protein [Acidianus infernus]MUM64379.1 hypothetical protein [Acidianus infernus]
MYRISFENGKTYIIKENGEIEEDENKNEENLQVIIVKTLTREKMEQYRNKGVKIFECKESQDLCLSKVLKILFGKPKSCKFA